MISGMYQVKSVSSDFMGVRQVVVVSPSGDVQVLKGRGAGVMFLTVGMWISETQVRHILASRRDW